MVGGERFGRYSFIGLPARTWLRASGFRSEVVTDGQVVGPSTATRWTSSRNYQSRFRWHCGRAYRVSAAPGHGYFGYDAVRHIEPKLARTWKSGGIDTPTSCCCRPRTGGHRQPVGPAVPDRLMPTPAQAESYFHAKRRLSELADKLRYSVTAPPVKRGPSLCGGNEFIKSRLPGRGGRGQGVHRRRRHDAGADRPAPEETLHREPAVAVPRTALTEPVAYMYFYDMGDFQIVGASPEILVRQEHTPEGAKVTIRPLAGTRPRGAAGQGAGGRTLSDPRSVPST